MRITTSSVSALLLSSILLVACGGGGNVCERAKARAQECYDTVCAEGGEGHPMCEAPLPDIENCAETAERAAERMLEFDGCDRILNGYSNAHSFQ
jgi:hypothetical protein